MNPCFKSFQSLVHFGWSMSVSTMRALSNYTQSIVDDDEAVMDAALDLGVFHTLPDFILANELVFKEEFYVRRFHQLVTDFIGN